MSCTARTPSTNSHAAVISVPRVTIKAISASAPLAPSSGTCRNAPEPRRFGSCTTPAPDPECGRTKRALYRPVTAPSPSGNRLPASCLQSINGPAAEADVPHHRRQSWDTRCPRSTRQSFSAHTSSPLRRSSHSRWRPCSLSVLVWSSSPTTRTKSPRQTGSRPRCSSRSRSSRPARASTAVPTRAPAVWRRRRSRSSRPARASTAVPTRAPAVWRAGAAQLPAGTRFDGGPDEGTRGARSYYESPNPAVQLSAGSRRWHQGSRRWPDHAPAGSWRSLDPQSDIR